MPERDRPLSAGPATPAETGGQAPIRIAYTLGVEDYAALANSRGLRRHLGQPPRWLWYALGLFVAYAGTLWIDKSAGPSPGWLAIVHFAMATVAFTAPTWYWVYLKRMARRQSRHGDAFALTLEKNAIRVENGEATGELAYDGIERIDERPEHLLLWLGRRRAAIVPKRAVGDAAAVRAFVGTLVARGAKA